MGVVNQSVGLGSDGDMDVSGRDVGIATRTGFRYLSPKHSVKCSHRLGLGQSI